MSRYAEPRSYGPQVYRPRGTRRRRRECLACGVDT